MKTCCSITVFLLVHSLVGAAFAADTTTSSTNSAGFRTALNSMKFLDDVRKLGPGDRILYRVIEDQDEPRSLTVTDSGDLEVPYLGLMRAADKTSLELAKEIKRALEKDLYYQATVLIAVELVNKTRINGRVYVAGQVKNTGSYEIPADERFTVSKAILKAGGFSDFSDKRNVRLIRKGGAKGAQTTLVVNVQDVWEKGKTEADRIVEPDDMIIVPARLVNF